MNQDVLAFIAWIWAHNPVIIVLLTGISALFLLVVIDTHRYRKNEHGGDGTWEIIIPSPRFNAGIRAIPCPVRGPLRRVNSNSELNQSPPHVGTYD